MSAHPKGLVFPQSLLIDPAKTVATWRGLATVKTAQITQIQQDGKQWQALDVNEDIIATSELMIIASGAGVKTIQFEDKGPLAALLALRFSRGQLSWASGEINYLNKNLRLSGQKGRASLRVTTANTLPRIIEIAPNLWVMTGLGSRGLTFAPLMADHWAAIMTGAPQAITPQGVEMFS